MKAEAPIALTPGQQLSAARREKGISLAQISQATRIIESRLEAIERDDYVAVGTSQAIVIGYVKAFAKQVDVPSGALIKVLDAYFRQRKITALNDSAAPLAPKITHFGPWLASALAVLVFLGLGQWYVSQQASSDYPQPVASDFAGTNESLAIEEKNNTPQESEAEASAQLKTASPTAPANNQAVLPVQAELPANEGDAENLAKISSENLPEEASSVSLNTTVPNNPFELDAQVGSDSLALIFSGECWLEIFDAKGKRLVMRLAKNQDVINLTGQAPFDLKLGDASVVAVKVNGREVELPLPPGQRVLRMQVGP